MDPDDGGQSTRRSFVFGAAMAGLFCLIAAALASTFRFLIPAVLYEPPTAFAIGKPDKFPPNSVVFLPQHRLFVFHRREGFSVVSSVCTHLGCNVRQASGSLGFECPCHGSTYDAVGNVTSGPAPKALSWHPLSFSRKGELVVDTGRKVGSEFTLVMTNREKGV